MAVSAAASAAVVEDLEVVIVVGAEEVEVEEEGVDRAIEGGEGVGDEEVGIGVGEVRSSSK